MSATPARNVFVPQDSRLRIFSQPTDNWEKRGKRIFQIAFPSRVLRKVLSEAQLSSIISLILEESVKQSYSNITAIVASVLRIFHYLYDHNLSTCFFRKQSPTLLSNDRTFDLRLRHAAIDGSRCSECFMQIAIVYPDIDAMARDLFCASYMSPLHTVERNASVSRM